MSAAIAPTGSPPTVPTVDAIVPEAAISVDFPTGTIVATEDAVWLFDVAGVTRVDPASNSAQRFDLAGVGGAPRPSYVATIAYGSLWVSDFDIDQVRRYDTSTGALRTTLDIVAPTGLTAGFGSMWITGHRDGTVRRIDPATNLETATLQLGRAGPSGPQDVVISEGRVWVAIPNERTVVAIDPASNQELGRLTDEAWCGVSGWDGQLFATGCTRGRLGIIDASAVATTATTELDGGAGTPVSIAGRFWVPVDRSTAGEILAVDPGSLVIGERFDLPHAAPHGMIVAFDSVWLAVEDESNRAAWLLRLPLAAFIP